MVNGNVIQMQRKQSRQVQFFDRSIIKGIIYDVQDSVAKNMQSFLRGKETRGKNSSKVKYSWIPNRASKSVAKGERLEGPTRKTLPKSKSSCQLLRVSLKTHMALGINRNPKEATEINKG